MPATAAVKTSTEEEADSEISDDEPEFGTTSEESVDTTTAAETKTEEADNDLGFD
jgi:hypothetical protein